eukprot:g6022.t1
MAKLSQIWFGLVFVLTMIPVYLIMSFIFLLPIGSEEKKRAYAIPVILAGFQWIFLLCPWIKLPRVDFSVIDVHVRGVVILMNHVSLIDPLATCAVLPIHFGKHTRTFLKAALLDVPIFGPCLRMAGHFPVYFRGEEAGNFSTDKEKMDSVKRRVDEHVKNGGSLMLYPEGQVNRDDPHKLLDFRYGTFDIAIRNNMPIYAYCAINADHCWPSKTGFGGLPCNMTGKIIKIFDPLPSNMDAQELAAHCQKLCRKSVKRSVLDACHLLSTFHPLICNHQSQATVFLTSRIISSC